MNFLTGVQKCRKIHGLGCVNQAGIGARVTQPSSSILLHFCTPVSKIKQIGHMHYIEEESWTSNVCNWDMFTQTLSEHNPWVQICWPLSAFALRPLMSARVRTDGVQGNPIHSSSLGNMGIRKMYMGTQGCFSIEYCYVLGFHGPVSPYPSSA